jgi:hypothetical protein
MPSYSIELEAHSMSVACIVIEAASEADARAIALADARKGEVVWDHETVDQASISVSCCRKSDYTGSIYESLGNGVDADKGCGCL